MSEFHKEQKHIGFALLYDSYNIEEKFKRHVSGIPYFVIKDKEEKRISAMLDSAIILGNAFQSRQASAISCVAIARNDDEHLAMQLGIIPVKPQGLNICLGCLAKAIDNCQEQLEVLKDIQEMTKTYAIKL